jgi:hypothetical protein
MCSEMTPLDINTRSCNHNHNHNHCLQILRRIYSEYREALGYAILHPSHRCPAIDSFTVKHPNKSVSESDVARCIYNEIQSVSTADPVQYVAALEEILESKYGYKPYHYRMGTISDIVSTSEPRAKHELLRLYHSGGVLNQDSSYSAYIKLEFTENGMKLLERYRREDVYGLIQGLPSNKLYSLDEIFAMLD